MSIKPLLAALAGFILWASPALAGGQADSGQPEDAAVVEELEMLEMLEVMEQLEMLENFDVIHETSPQNWAVMEKEAD